MFVSKISVSTPGIALCSVQSLRLMQSPYLVGAMTSLPSAFLGKVEIK